ncbi:MAG: BMP family lipoprotein [Fusobacteriota bacterium]
MKKTLVAVLLGVFISSMAFGGIFDFFKKGDKEDSQQKKIGIVLSTGGLGDQSFNDSAYRGLKEAEEDFNIEFRYVEPASSAEDEQYLRQFAETDYDLIVGTGFLMANAVEKMATDYPDTQFAIIDSVVDKPNVASLVFKEHEGSFLVGALAAMMTESDVIGFVGGMDVPLIRKFQAGYIQGAKYVNEDIEVLSVYTSGSSNPFNDPVAGKENTLSLIKQDADVIYHAAGGTGMGVIESAKQQEVYAIGVDSNQDPVAPGTVLTSMIKKVDNAVYNVTKDVVNDNFQGGIHSFGVAEEGVGVTDYEFTKDEIGEENIKRVEEIKAKIKSGEIEVSESIE